jgi:hypothetical protein
VKISFSQFDARHAPCDADSLTQSKREATVARAMALSVAPLIAVKRQAKLLKGDRQL